MEKEIVQGKLGSVGEYEVAFKEKKLFAKAGVSAPEGLGTAGMFVEIPAGPVVDKLFKFAEDAIPGEIDNLILEQVKAFLKKALEL